MFDMRTKVYANMHGCFSPKFQQTYSEPHRRDVMRLPSQCPPGINSVRAVIRVWVMLCSKAACEGLITVLGHADKLASRFAICQDVRSGHAPPFYP